MYQSKIILRVLHIQICKVLHSDHLNLCNLGNKCTERKQIFKKNSDSVPSVKLK